LQRRAVMNELIDSILRLGSCDVASEEAACDALVALRFPGGISCPCGALCTRDLATVTCARRHTFTILVDTPFASKRRPRVRALFLAIRAFAVSPRSVSAREIARDVGAPHVTIWRHLLTLRALLPPPIAQPTSHVATAQLCGRNTDAQRAWVRVGVRVAATCERQSRRGGAEGRMLGESLRTTLNGTFHGVTARWLPAYLDEAVARWRIGGDVGAWLVQRLLDVVAQPLTFLAVRRHFGS
jgi:hypothetical protein